jgi:hypothetical protein
LREFETAVAAARAEDEQDEYPIDFAVLEISEDDDGAEKVERVICHARQPGEGEVIVLIADAMGRRSSLPEKVAAIIDFLIAVLDDESQDYIVGRLMDPRDPFGISEIEPIVFALMEEMGGRPTKQPSDFARSRKTGGQNSQRRTRKSTSSASARTAS